MPRWRHPWLEAWWAWLIFLHISVGMYANGYAQWAGFDKALHAFSMAGLALLLIEKTRHVIGRYGVPVSNTVLASVSLIGVLGVGAAWEIVEFAIDRTRWFKTQHGLSDTMTDMIANGTGALLASIAWGLFVTVPKSTDR